MTHVAVVHQHTNNYGDDAAGVALVEGVQRELGADTVDVFYIWHKNGRRISTGGAAVRHHMPRVLAGTHDERPRLALTALLWPLSGRADRGLAEMVARCRAADAVFVAPAGSNLGVYKDWTYLLTLVVLVRSGVRLRFVQNTIVSSGSAVFDRLALYVLRRSEVAVREAASARWLASHRVGAYLGVDTALLLADRQAGACRPRSGAPYVAVVPTRLGSWHPAFRGFDDERFLRTVLARAVADVAAERGLEVRIVPHLAGPEAEHTIHELLLDELAGAGRPASVAEVGALDDYRTALAQAEVVVSMRYHGLVLSGMAGVPCVSLSYENKMHEAATYLGMADLELDMHDVDEPALRARLTDALDRRASIRERLDVRVAELRQIASGPLRSARAQLLRRRSARA